MDRSTRSRYRNIISVCAVITAVICVIVLFFFRNSAFLSWCQKILSILTPFIYGAAIAYLLHPMSLFFERQFKKLFARCCKREHNGAARMIAILISLVIMFAVIILLLIAVIPEVASSISNLISQIPDAIDTFYQWLESMDKGDTSHEIVSAVKSAVDTFTEWLQNYLQNDVLPNLQSLISNVTSSVMNLLNVLKNFGLGCIVAAYFLGGWEKFISQAKMITYALFPQRAADWIRNEVHVVDHMFSGFIHGKLVDSLIIGVLCFIFCTIVQMPYTMLVSVIVGVTNIIPFFGPYLGAIPSALLILTQSWQMCLVFVVFIIILQQFDGNYLGPRILGDAVGVSGFWIMFAILFFGDIWGFWGMLLGVPVFAVIYDLITRLVVRWLKKRGREDLIEKHKKAFDKPQKRARRVRRAAGVQGEPAAGGECQIKDTEE